MKDCPNGVLKKEVGEIDLTLSILIKSTEVLIISERGEIGFGVVEKRCSYWEYFLRNVSHEGALFILLIEFHACYWNHFLGAHVLRTGIKNSSTREKKEE